MPTFKNFRNQKDSFNGWTVDIQFDSKAFKTYTSNIMMVMLFVVVILSRLA